MIDVRIPDLVVRIEVLDVEVAQVAFFKGKTVHDDIEIVAGIEERTLIPFYITALEQAIRTLKQTDWFTLDELDTGGRETKNGLPF